ncbi:hypothetical protein YYC_05096 [Plasmodium yoelii 17X]|uniref:YIR protein n=1 Tax=Plasmodium yoelii 17X TaxID=1323249 RepID=V7PC61_PLAYE|nr:hypothetical protein YYC_05096 [Plasmodium yoelii 17X]
MDGKICRTFFSIKNSIPDILDKNGNYQFIMNHDILNQYCSSNNCNNNIDKINAGCLYLFDAFFKDKSVFNSVAKNNIDIVDYIMLWLSYMLNLKENEFNNGLQFFYSTTINNDKYKNSIADITEYTSYKDLIDKKKYFLGMDRNIIFNFYEAFKLVCEMYTNFDETKSYCSNCSGNANKFVSKYKKMNQNSDITSNSSYNKLLSTLSNEYNNFKNYYTSKGGNSNDIPSLTSIENIHTSAHSSEDTPSSSSITTKLFTVLSIFGAIAFFLGISYKYSLFGFRKRFQKQKLREKIKNIKKRINH